MPLNWLQHLQYPDVLGAAQKDATTTNINLQNRELNTKNALQQRLLKSMQGGGQGKNALMEELAIVDPTSANALMKVQDTLNPTPFSGEGFQNQLAGAQYRAYIKAGYDPDEAARLAGSDVMRMKQDVYTDEMGNTHRVTSNPLPQISPRAREMIGAVVNAPEESRPTVYKQQLKIASEEGMDISDLPEEYSPEMQKPLMELFGAVPEEAGAEPVNLFSDAGENADNAITNAPKVKVARGEENAKLTAKRVADMRADASAAADTIEDFQRVYEAYNSGFKGGPLAGFDMGIIRAKSAINQPLTQEEQEYANNYSMLESTAKINVAKTIKPIFGGNISDGERTFATDLQAAPLDIQEQAIAKAAVQEAGALQKIRKIEMLDEWEHAYGAPEAKNSKGKSFEQFYAKYAQENPILTPEFMSERGAVVPVKTVKQAEALAVGTRFMAPDGKIRTRKAQGNNGE
jgi:hypothetical protein